MGYCILFIYVRGVCNLGLSHLQASRNLLHKRKVPLIIGVMESLDMQGSDASFVIRDPSGRLCV